MRQYRPCGAGWGCSAVSSVARLAGSCLRNQPKCCLHQAHIQTKLLIFCVAGQRQRMGDEATFSIFRAGQICTTFAYSASPVVGGPGRGGIAHCKMRVSHPRRRFAYFADAGKVSRPAGRNIPISCHFHPNPPSPVSGHLRQNQQNFTFLAFYHAKNRKNLHHKDSTRSCVFCKKDLQSEKLGVIINRFVRRGTNQNSQRCREFRHTRERGNVRTKRRGASTV